MRDAARGHFRAHARRRVRLDVTLEGPEAGRERAARIIDASLAGAGLELDTPVSPGDRVVISITTPALWDPLRVPARVAWTDDPARHEMAGRVRAGVTFEHEGPEAVLATWEMLASLVYD